MPDAIRDELRVLGVVGGFIDWCIAGQGQLGFEVASGEACDEPPVEGDDEQQAGQAREDACSRDKGDWWRPIGAGRGLADEPYDTSHGDGSTVAKYDGEKKLVPSADDDEDRGCQDAGRRSRYDYPKQRADPRRPVHTGGGLE